MTWRRPAEEIYISIWPWEWTCGNALWNLISPTLAPRTILNKIEKTKSIKAGDEIVNKMLKYFAYSSISQGMAARIWITLSQVLTVCLLCNIVVRWFHFHVIYHRRRDNLRLSSVDCRSLLRSINSLFILTFTVPWWDNKIIARPRSMFGWTKDNDDDVIQLNSDLWWISSTIYSRYRRSSSQSSSACSSRKSPAPPPSATRLPTEPQPSSPYSPTEHQ